MNAVRFQLATVL